MPPSNITSMSEPTASTILRQRRDRRRRAVELAAAVIGDHDARRRRSWTASLASSTSSMPLMISLPGHRLLIHSTSFQVSVGIELGRRSTAPATSTLSIAWHMAGEIAEGLALAASARSAPRPAWWRCRCTLRKRELRRHRHAVLDVAVALAEHLQVDGEHQRAAFRRRRALDQRLRRSRGPSSHRAGTRTACRPPPPRPRSSRSTWCESVNGMPAACAARQARISPSPCCMPREPDRRQRQRQRHRLAEDGGRRGRAATRRPARAGAA